MKKRSQDENTILKNTIPARGSSTHPEQMGGKEKKGRAEWLRITGSILTPESSKNQGAFLARNSVAVAPAFAHCTNPCTRRKVTVTAQSTKQENRKMKRRSQHENTKLPIRSPRAALLLLSQSFWWGADEQSQDKPSETKFISIDLVRSIRKRRRLHGRRWTRGARTRSRPRGAPKKTC